MGTDHISTAKETILRKGGPKGKSRVNKKEPPAPQGMAKAEPQVGPLSYLRMTALHGRPI